ncbi:MAG: ABC-F family ATP-binding cassette domain-containing protein [Oscillospiraceae bacterium]|jgi:ATP-binding cassette subfamily F protein 3|nr:ABC-F family ATP-binding cassette domain-containing protein [Oscillospiraceae bacterium]
MVIISVSQLEKYFGERLLFSTKGFDISVGDRVGLVGANGTGKTTLFKILLGTVSADGGHIAIGRDARIGCMEQHVVNASTHAAYEEVLAGFADLIAREVELDALHAQLEYAQGDALDALIHLHHDKSEAFQAQGGLTFRSRARAALLGLGFGEEDLTRPVSAFSGGERSKLSLAKLLVSEANLLLLDEPTNHLDMDAVAWLEDYLKAFKGTVIVISHDRYFLDKITTRTLEIENRKIQAFKGNFSAWLVKKKEQRQIALHHYKSAMAAISKQQESIKKLKSYNREKSIKRAESKEKMLARMMDALETPDAEADDWDFSFPTRRVSGNDVLLCRDLGKSFGEKVIFRHADLDIKRGEAVFLLGSNGCGKTTLLKEILARGRGVSFGAGVDMAYYDQTLANLHEENTVLQEVWGTYPRLTQTTVRSSLAAFLFRGDEVYKPIRALSGGERARVALVKIMLSGANLLILDEPTNHLDIAAVEALEDALSLYEGTMLIVSHDRFFINKLADKIYQLTPEGTTLTLGGYDEYLRRRVAEPRATVAAAPKSPKQNEYLLKKEQAADERKRRGRIQKLEALIAQKEQESAQLEAQLADPAVASDYEQVHEHATRLDKIQTELEEALEELINLDASFAMDN